MSDVAEPRVVEDFVNGEPACGVNLEASVHKVRDAVAYRVLRAGDPSGLGRLGVREWTFTSDQDAEQNAK